jgi:prolyl 4-hydroxylase
MLTQAFALAKDGQPEEAMRIITELARRGEPEALFTLGDQYWRGGAVPQDHARGRELFRLASDAGHPMARRAYTNLLANGIAGPADWPAAMRRLREEAAGDTRRAQMASLIAAMDLTAAGDPKSLPVGEKLSEAPQITRFRGAVSAAECEFLIVLAEPMFAPSLVSSAKGDIRDPIRTSDGSTMHWLVEDPMIHAINRRLAALSDTHVEQGEAMQVLRYRPGQQYRRHVDWLGDTPGQRRILTALVYLNDDYDGGETEFHKIALTIKARRGDVLVFRSEGPDGRLDPLTEHAGLPITRGVKYLASRWIREARHTV